MTRGFSMTRQWVLMSALLLAPVLQAHTMLTTSLPEDGAVLGQSPQVLQLMFADPVRLMRLSLANSESKNLALNYRPDGKLAKEHSHHLPAELLPGSYYLQWSAMASDAHNMTGQIHFVVEPSASKEPSAGKNIHPDSRQEP